MTKISRDIPQIGHRKRAGSLAQPQVRDQIAKTRQRKITLRRRHLPQCIEHVDMGVGAGKHARPHRIDLQLRRHDGVIERAEQRRAADDQGVLFSQVDQYLVDLCIKVCLDLFVVRDGLAGHRAD